MSNASFGLVFSASNTLHARREGVKEAMWTLGAGVRKDARKRVHKVERYEGKLTLARELSTIAGMPDNEQLSYDAQQQATKGRAFSTEELDMDLASLDPARFYDLEMDGLLSLTAQISDEEPYSAVDRELAEVMGCAVSADFGWDAMAQLSLEADGRAKRAKKAFQAHRDDDGEEIDY